MTRLTETLLRLCPDRLLSAADLAELVPGSADARYALVKRALAGGELLRIRRGLYTLSPQLGKHPIHPFCAAQLVHGPSYVSLESALSFHGLIPEAVYTTTSVSLDKARLFTTPLGSFHYACVPQRVLFTGVERIVDAAGVFFIASPLKALADYVHVRKPDGTGMRSLAGSLRIDEDALPEFDDEEIGMLLANYGKGRARAFLSGLRGRSWK